MAVRFVAVAFLAIALLASGVAAAPYFTSEIVNGPDEEFTYCHSPSIVELANGDLLCTWYAKTRQGDKQERYCRKPAGALAWTPPKTLVDTPGYDDWNPVLWQDPTGKVWCFCNHKTDTPPAAFGKGGRPVESSSAYLTSQLMYITSTDNGHTWSKPVTMFDEIGYWVRCSPLVTGKGNWIVPGYDERDWSSLMYISTDEGRTWKMSKRIDTGGGWRANTIQPSVIELSDGRLRALCRMGDLDPETTHLGPRERQPIKVHIQESYSEDGGWTWTQPKPMGLPNPNSSVAQCRLKNGHVVLIFNNSFAERTPLTAALSVDEGRTWTAMRDLDRAADRLDYPEVIQTSDGLIYAVYRRRSAARIVHAVFNEEWVAGGG